MKKRIALYGKSGSGKDFVTSKLKSELTSLNFSVQRFAFADKVKEHIKSLLEMSENDFKLYLHNEDFKNHSIVDVSNMSMIVKSDVNHTHPTWSLLTDSKTLNDMKYQYDEFNDNKIYMTLREFTVFYGTFVIQKNLGRKTWCNALFNKLDEWEEFPESFGIDTCAIVTDCRFPHEYKMCKEKGFVFIKVEDVDNLQENLNNIAESFYDDFEPDYIFHNSKTNENKFKKELEMLISWLKC